MRVIGYSRLFEPGDHYYGFPEEFRTRPGDHVVMLDGVDASDRFHVFIHGPFKEGVADARNETSVAMRVTVGTAAQPLSGLFLGDVSYPTLTQIFDETHRHDNDAMLGWNALLAPHHCSKKVMYETVDGKEYFRDRAMDEFAACQLGVGYVVSSSLEFASRDASGDLPPHTKARNRYEEIVNNDFVCTAEFSTPENVRPMRPKAERLCSS